MFNNRVPNAEIPLARPIEEEIPVAHVISENGMPSAEAIDKNAQNTHVLHMEENKQKSIKAVQDVEEQLTNIQQKPKKADKSLQTETDFELQQSRLLNEYVKKINLAVQYKAKANYMKAIQEYNNSITCIEQLISICKSKEFQRDNYVYSVPDAYSSKIHSSRLEIANCMMANGQLTQAYDYLAKLPRHQNITYSIAIDTKISECRKLISERAQKLTAMANSMLAFCDPAYDQEAISALNEVQRLQRKIGNALDASFLKLQATFEWRLKRGTINAECALLLNRNLVLSDYTLAAKKARDLMREYQNFDNVLFTEDRIYLGRLKGVMPALEQVEAQLKINALILEFEQDLQDNDLVSAHAKMSSIYALSKRITDPKHLTQLGLNYTCPETYRKQLRSLEVNVQEYKQRAEQQHSLIVEKIINLVLQKLQLKIKDASLLEQDLTELRVLLTKEVKRHWYKFDSRPEPSEFMSDLVATINSHIVDIGVFKRWYNWTYATSTFADRSKALDVVVKQIHAYIPSVLPDIGLSCTK